MNEGTHEPMKSSPGTSTSITSHPDPTPSITPPPAPPHTITPPLASPQTITSPPTTSHTTAAPPVTPSAAPNPLVEQYLTSLNKNLRWVPKTRKEQFQLEVRGHIEEIASTIMGDDQTRYTMAIQRFGEPELVAGQFVEAYGCGKKYLIVMSLAGFFLALFTIPIRVPFVPELRLLCMGLPLLMTIVVFYLIIRVSMRAGKWTGFAVGVSSGTARLLALGAFLTLIARDPDLEDKIAVPEGVIAGILLVSLLMAVSGYIPGRTLQRYHEDLS